MNSDNTSPKAQSDKSLTLLNYTKRRLAALLVFLAVICLCVAAAAQPNPKSATLLQKAAVPQTSASTDQTQPATLPFITKDDSGNGSGSTIAGSTGNATSGQTTPGTNSSSPSSTPAGPATTPATGSPSPTQNPGQSTCGCPHASSGRLDYACPMYCVL